MKERRTKATPPPEPARLTCESVAVMCPYCDAPQSSTDAGETFTREQLLKRTKGATSREIVCPSCSGRFSLDLEAPVHLVDNPW